eukprot:CAMPEP_0174739070 /NCGR_PEP_ID=MMETSP1094-20130205/71010_1 /TAXON_ID=156173 /ORGANISM="Chrysochromulina brevifilum, Strain UTEX LB 985" /LENGTH=64 /DNA_ID=CAMNT_0015942587 /DNA_START=545 /DNA_END=739 /DNA_ORIENTATION=+
MGADVIEHKLHYGELRVEEGMDHVTPPRADDGVTINDPHAGAGGELPRAVGLPLVAVDAEGSVD